MSMGEKLGGVGAGAGSGGGDGARAGGGGSISVEQVRRLGRLARLEVEEGEAEELRVGIGAVLGYVEVLRGLGGAVTDKGGGEGVGEVEVGESGLRGDAEEGIGNAGTLGAGVVKGLSPGVYEDGGRVWVRVPRVLGEGGGA